MGNAYIYKDEYREGAPKNPKVKMLLRQLDETRSVSEYIRADLYQAQLECKHIYYKLDGLSPSEPVLWVCSECGHRSIK